MDQQYLDQMDTVFSFSQEKKRENISMFFQQKVNQSFGWNQKLNLQKITIIQKEVLEK